MFTKYNINYWYKELAYFYRFLLGTLNHMFWVLFVPVIMTLKLGQEIIRLLWAHPKPRRQIEPGKWQELEQYELRIPPRFL